VPTQLATPLGKKHRAVSSPFLLRRERHQEAAIYNGNMNSQSFYVDANNYYVDVARSYDMCTTSAIPCSDYMQTPMQNNLPALNSYNYSNLQHVYSNSHASATTEVHMPMNNVMNSVNQYETPNVIDFNSMQNSVSPFYPSANNLQYVDSPSHMPMDRAIGISSTVYLANYTQPSYATLMLLCNWRYS
jgi:hypothetical protein